MVTLDLRELRCPLALVTLKRELLLTTEIKNRSLKLFFSSVSAMSDIILYLDKKGIYYQMSEDENLFVLIVTINKSKDRKKC
ncbi:sulfurtransferase TusA family protein [Psychromonas hadalis]|uniref:sulfurtransferase TusA family protein n=1 Tax=Psychromonas hadalis TaxID=211669 RepID=UPI00042477D1|nr:sulfurtransferase TusA family protein [Psychromonas hadalis]